MEAMLIVITAEHESAVTVEKVLLKRYESICFKAVQLRPTQVSRQCRRTM